MSARDACNVGRSESLTLSGLDLQPGGLDQNVIQLFLSGAFGFLSPSLSNGTTNTAVALSTNLRSASPAQLSLDADCAHLID